MDVFAPGWNKPTRPRTKRSPATSVPCCRPTARSNRPSPPRRSCKDRVKALEEAVKQTVAAQHLSEQRYAQGVGDYLVVLESQTRAVTSQSDLLSVRRALLDNRVDLHLALGGGFDYPTDSATADAAGEDSAL